MSHAPPPPDEPRAVAARYARRAAAVGASRYDPRRPEVLQERQDRERALVGLLNRHMPARRLADLDILEVGCGAGDNLLDLLRLGAEPARLAACELLPERAARARSRLPAAVRLHEGDALAAGYADASFDLVLQYTVFSSLLDAGFRARLAQAMWRWLKPGGAVVWYDFAFDNPRNPDVRGVPLAEVRQLFPEAVAFDARRLTLAPPLARAAVRVHPAIGPHIARLLHALPLLRTHRLVWIGRAG